MNIELYLSKENHIALMCDQRFTQDIEEVVLDPQTGIISIVFQGRKEFAELNCAIDMETCEKIKDELFCALGYFEDGELKSAQYTRFRVGVVY